VKERGATKLICSSGGNAGKAVAYAARMLGVPAVVVVPKSTLQFMIDSIKDEGATVIVQGDHWKEADEYARKLMEQEDGKAGYIHPFDNPDIWEGNSSLITELRHDLPFTPGLIVCVVGGGGLLCGVAEGLHKVGWEKVPILAVETDGAQSYYASVMAGHLVTLPAITSVAKTLGAARVAEEAFNWYKKHTIVPCVVSDRVAVNACLRFADEHRIIVEPSCGAGLAALYEKTEELTNLNPDSIVVIVCGGNMATTDFLKELASKLNHGP